MVNFSVSHQPCRQVRTLRIAEVLEDGIDDKVSQQADPQKGCVRSGNGYHCEGDEDNGIR